MLKTFITATAISGLMVTSALRADDRARAFDAACRPATCNAGAADAGKFIAAQKPDQWLASKFSGTDVIGPNNEKIGDVNDVLFDKDGKISRRHRRRRRLPRHRPEGRRARDGRVPGGPGFDCSAAGIPVLRLRPRTPITRTT